MTITEIELIKSLVKHTQNKQFLKKGLTDMNSKELKQKKYVVSSRSINNSSNSEMKQHFINIYQAWNSFARSIRSIVIRNSGNFVINTQYFGKFLIQQHDNEQKHVRYQPSNELLQVCIQQNEEKQNINKTLQNEIKLSFDLVSEQCRQSSVETQQYLEELSQHLIYFIKNRNDKNQVIKLNIKIGILSIINKELKFIPFQLEDINNSNKSQFSQTFYHQPQKHRNHSLDNEFLNQLLNKHQTKDILSQRSQERQLQMLPKFSTPKIGSQKQSFYIKKQSTQVLQNNEKRSQSCQKVRQIQINNTKDVNYQSSQGINFSHRQRQDNNSISSYMKKPKFDLMGLYNKNENKSQQRCESQLSQRRNQTNDSIFAKSKNMLSEHFIMNKTFCSLNNTQKLSQRSKLTEIVIQSALDKYKNLIQEKEIEKSKEIDQIKNQLFEFKTQFFQQQLKRKEFIDMNTQFLKTQITEKLQKQRDRQLQGEKIFSPEQTSLSFAKQLDEKQKLKQMYLQKNDYCQYLQDQILFKKSHQEQRKKEQKLEEHQFLNNIAQQSIQEQLEYKARLEENKRLCKEIWLEQMELKQKHKQLKGYLI